MSSFYRSTQVYKVTAIAIISALVLSGCTTTSPAERRAIDESRCASYGFKPNTEKYAECLLSLDLDRRAAQRDMLRSAPSPMFGPMIIIRQAPPAPRD